MDTNNKDIHNKKILKQQIKEIGEYYDSNNLERIFNVTKKKTKSPE